MLIDFFHETGAREIPFASLPSSRELPLQFEDALSELNHLFERLHKQQQGNSLRRSLIHLNREASRLLACEVLTLAGDDDELDLASLSASGVLQRVRFRAGATTFEWNANFGVSEVRTPSNRLHDIISNEVAIFLGRIPLEFPFGGEVGSLNLEVQAQSSPLPAPPTIPPRGGWAAAAAREEAERRKAQIRNTFTYRLLRKWHELTGRLPQKK